MHAGGELVQSPGGYQHGPGKAVQATMKKSGLHIDAEELSQGVQTPCTELVWVDGAWSGDSVSYKQLFADAGRLMNHATDAPRVSRRETSECRWKHVTAVTDEVPDATDSFHNEFERVNESGEQFFRVHDVLEAAIARDEGRLAEEAEGRELPERPLLEQTTLECA